MRHGYWNISQWILYILYTEWLEVDEMTAVANKKPISFVIIYYRLYVFLGLCSFSYTTATTNVNAAPPLHSYGVHSSKPLEPELMQTHPHIFHNHNGISRSGGVSISYGKPLPPYFLIAN